jgi:hypothetical protein
MDVFSNIGFCTCISILPVFIIFSLVFHFAGEKSLSLISGFNSFSEEQRAEYDTAKLIKDYRNNFIIWSLLMVAGAVFSYFISGYCAIPAFIILMISVFKDFHMFPEDAFSKYKIKK